MGSFWCWEVRITSNLKRFCAVSKNSCTSVYTKIFLAFKITLSVIAEWRNLCFNVLSGVSSDINLVAIWQKKVAEILPCAALGLDDDSRKMLEMMIIEKKDKNKTR